MDLIPAHERHAAADRLGRDVSTATSVHDAILLAGLDWDVRLQDASAVTIPDSNDPHTQGTQTLTFPGRRLIVREGDDPVILGVAGSRYTACQNEEFFALADVAAKAGARFTHAGELDYGRTVFMQMHLPSGDVKVGGHDLMRTHLRFQTTHDGGGAHVAIVTTRLICTNGMHIALPGLSPVTRLRHTSSLPAQIKQAHGAIKLAVQRSKALAALGEELLSRPMTETDFLALADSMWSEPERLDEKLRITREWRSWNARRDGLRELFLFAETNELGRGTRYAGLNALIEWNEWGSPVRASSESGRVQRLAARQFDVDTAAPTRFAQLLTAA